MTDLFTERLRLQPLSPALAGTFHDIVVDPHVRQYLFDGTDMERSWCDDAIVTSQRALTESGLGLWLVSARDVPIGFCGFWQFPDLGPEPQLLYAFIQSAAGRGYATEVGRALVDYAIPGRLAYLTAAVDSPNAASSRVLGKLGFLQVGERPGPFGKTLLYRLDP